MSEVVSCAPLQICIVNYVIKHNGGAMTGDTKRLYTSKANNASAYIKIEKTTATAF